MADARRITNGSGNEMRLSSVTGTKKNCNENNWIITSGSLCALRSRNHITGDFIHAIWLRCVPTSDTVTYRLSLFVPRNVDDWFWCVCVSLWLTLSRTRHVHTAYCRTVLIQHIVSSFYHYYCFLYFIRLLVDDDDDEIITLCDELHHLRIRVAKISRFSWVFCVSVCDTKTVCHQIARCRLFFHIASAQTCSVFSCVCSDAQNGSAFPTIGKKAAHSW